MRWDTVVVGSGAGGLAAAVALARAGQKVLVLEQHYLPGGFTHSFHLDGYRFSPGVHYLGELGPGGGLRALFDGLGVSDRLEWRQLHPDGFDHVLIDGERFDQPAGFERYLARLCERFPSQRDGLHRYFRVIGGLVDDLRRSGQLLRFPAVLALPLRAPALLRWGFRTLKALLDAYLTDPLLKAVLSAQCGNHALPPSRVSLPAHALMSAHYFDGAWYPRGGGRAIPLAFVKQLQAHGGSIRMRARVRRIIVEKGRVAGVHLSDGERIDAGQVVCNADPAVVYGTLLDPALCGRQLRKLERTEYSPSVVSAFCAVDLDLEKLGYDSGNYWWFGHADVEGIYERARTALQPEALESVFVSISSLKDPGHAPHGHHTVEMLSLVPYAPFDGLAHDSAYEALKRRLGDQMLAAAENVIPGIRRRLKFMAVGTPLTNDRYCNVFRGACYGTAKTPWQVGPFSFSQRGPVEGLHLCGASTLSHGVAGALFSGVIAASRILGLPRPEDCFTGPAPVPLLQPAPAT
jgi:phytoene dehydrogenase-like protein